MDGGIEERALGRLGRTLFPHFCLVCGEEGRLLCRTCEAGKYAPERGIFFSLGSSRNRRVASSFELQASSFRCFSAGRYSDPVLRELLHLFKYGRVEEAGQILSDFLAVRVGRHITALLDGESDPMVVAMPMNPVNRALRGFNQAETLAGAVSRELELEIVEGVLKRRFAWKAQATIADPRKRRGNIHEAFESVGPLYGRDILLVDDVLTTGATVRECAKALIRAGAGRVSVVTALMG